MERKFYIRISLLLIALISWGANTSAKKKFTFGPSYAWSITEPLCERFPSTIDTLQLNYHRQALAWMPSIAWNCTGNLGAEGINMIFFDRPQMSEFFFSDALSAWLPSLEKQRFYNTKIPMTLLSYNTGGGRDATQDRLRAEFSGNVNKRLQFGAGLDYIYSKGSYQYQADKDFSWKLSSSYIGDRYELQAFINSYNFLNKENGGITDDRYITDLQAFTGNTKIDAKSIPVKFSNAHSKITGTDFVMNHRYKVGYYHHERDSLTDTIKSSTYIPVTSFIWTFRYKGEKHMYRNDAPGEDMNYFPNTYLSDTGSEDYTRYWKITNTVGIQLLEGFHKYAKFGLAAFVTHEYRRYYQNSDSALLNPSERLTPFPDIKVPQVGNENLLYVGGQLTKKKGSLLNYNVVARFGLIGASVGDIDVKGDVSTKFKLWRDTVTIRAYGYFKNIEAPYLTNHFISNHFAWENKFGKTRRFRVGGELNIPFSGTNINVGFENIQNHIFFNSNGMPEQYGNSVQILSVTLKQNLHWRALHWDNEVTFQTTSNQSVIPLPKVALNTNLYAQFPIVRVLKVQAGIDCNYYTLYKAPVYNPATMTFCNQDKVEIGNYPVMNVYINFKLYKARFFVMMSHLNQGWFGKNAFNSPHYPINTRKFQFGISVDFAN